MLIFVSLQIQQSSTSFQSTNQAAWVLSGCMLHIIKAKLLSLKSTSKEKLYPILIFGLEEFSIFNVSYNIQRHSLSPQMLGQAQF